MPNHITNELTIGSNHKEVLDFIKSDEDEVIDFNKIIEQPSELNIEVGGLTGLLENEFRQSISLKKELDRIRESINEVKYLENFICGIRNYVKYGHATWYSWNISNWGTKWNAYDTNKIRFDKIKFQTAWSPPIPVITQLSNIFKEIEFELRYADEFTGYNCGVVLFCNGKVDHLEKVDGSKEAYDLAFELNPDRKKCYIFDGVTYQHKNCKKCSGC